MGLGGGGSLGREGVGESEDGLRTGPSVLSAEAIIYPAILHMHTNSSSPVLQHNPLEPFA